MGDLQLAEPTSKPNANFMKPFTRDVVSRPELTVIGNLPAHLPFQFDDSCEPALAHQSSFGSDGTMKKALAHHSTFGSDITMQMPGTGKGKAVRKPPKTTRIRTPRGSPILVPASTVEAAAKAR